MFYLNYSGELIMSKRLFIAYKIPSELRNKMLIFQHSIKENGTYSGIKWVKPENMHITIAFLGQVNGTLVPQIKSAISDSDFSPVTIKTGKPEFFWKNNIPAILYINLNNTNNLEKYANKLRSKLSDNGIQFDRKNFTAHITVARIRDEHSANLLHKYINKNLDIYKSKDYTINNIILFESVFEAKGLQYIQLFKKVREF